MLLISVRVVVFKANNAAGFCLQSGTENSPAETVKRSCFCRRERRTCRHVQLPSSHPLVLLSLVSWFIALAELSRENKRPSVFAVHFCTYSKDLSEECVEVRGHPCCALYSEKDQHSLFLLIMRRIRHTLVDLSSAFQWRRSLNAPPFGRFSLSLPTFCHFCYYYRCCCYSRCMFVYFLNSSLEKSFYLRSSVNGSEDLPPADAAVFQRSLHSHSIPISVFLWIYSSDTNLLRLRPVEPDCCCSLLAWLMSLLILH